MSEEFIPKNKHQAEGYAIGKTLAKAFTAQINAKDAEIERLKSEKKHTGIQCIGYIGELAEAGIEIKRLKEQVKAAFFRGATFVSSYHSCPTPLHVIEEAFYAFELDQTEAAK